MNVVHDNYGRHDQDWHGNISMVSPKDAGQGLSKPFLEKTHNTPPVNATVLFSDIAGELAKDRPFGACYFDRGDGKRQWSLRSRDGGIDVAEVAKANGGGGHRNAAGFEQVV